MNTHLGRLDRLLMSLVLLIAVVSSPPSQPHEPRFEISDCGDDSALVHFENVKISPLPVPVPGGVNLNGTLYVSKPLGGSTLSIDMTVYRLVGNLPVYIPCIMNSYGSCSYQDICRLAPPQCPTGFDEAKVPCHCPIPPGQYAIPTFFKEIDIRMASALYGDFKVIAKLLQQVNNQPTTTQLIEIGCASFVVSVGGNTQSKYA